MRTAIFNKDTANGTNVVYRSSELRYTRRGPKMSVTYDVYIGCESDGETEYGYLSRFNFSNKAEAVKYARQTIAPLIGCPDHFVDMGPGCMSIRVINAKSEKDSAKRGIHLLTPTNKELQDAKQTAERDGFLYIYIHNDKTWPNARTA